MFFGSIPALVTPFAAGRVEEAIFRDFVAWQIREVKKTFGPDTALGRRRTVFEDAPDTSDLDFAEATVEREPITVIVSQKGWIRSMKGHVADLSGVQFKGDDALKTSFFTETTAKILVVASNGKVFTLDDHIVATEGVECRKDADVIDETPAAYKPIDKVMAAQADLVEVVHTLKQVVCVKG